MSYLVRPYRPSDYSGVEVLYRDEETYGGQFDPDRDSRERLAASRDLIWVCEFGDTIAGTVSLIVDERSAWLHRFAVSPGQDEKAIAGALYLKAKEVLSEKGHSQVVVYCPVGNDRLARRYQELGFASGNRYQAYWAKW